MSRRDKLAGKRDPISRVAVPSDRGNLWERYWFGSVAAIRPYLLMKTVLILLAFDMWLLRIYRGRHYGEDGFNVANFRWLDAVQPLPSPDLYVGLMLLVGILALVCAFTGAGRLALGVLTLLYTYGWAMSMMDGYQHHYFLSLVLTAFVFFPRLHADDLYQTDGAPGDRPTPKAGASHAGNRSVSSWGYVLLGATVAIVYVFTAVAKSDVTWRTGQILYRVAGLRQLLQPVEDWFPKLGLSRELFWGLFGLSAVAGELLIVLGYLVAVRLDVDRRPWLRIVTWLAFVAAIGLHVSVELFLPLRIGWFSYFMIVLACVYFLPESILWAVGTAAIWPAVGLARVRSVVLAAMEQSTGDRQIVLIRCAATAVAILVGAVGFSLDLPGAKQVGVLAAFVLIGATWLARRRREGAMRYLIATGLATVLMWTAITKTSVRFNYYQYAGYSAARRGKLKSALKDYKKAALYAPEGKSVQPVVDALRRQLRRSADAGGPKPLDLQEFITHEDPYAAGFDKDVSPR